jgi:hypothetical protein
MNWNLFPTVKHGRDSAYYVGEETVRKLMAKGCAMCQREFKNEFVCLEYEVSHCGNHILLEPHEFAELQIASLERNPTFNAISPSLGGLVIREYVYIVDKKAAVCLQCWVSYMKQIVALAKESPP